MVEVVQAGGQTAELKVTNKSPNWPKQTTMIVQAQGQIQVGPAIQPNVISQQFPIENRIRARAPRCSTCSRSPACSMS